MSTYSGSDWLRLYDKTSVVIEVRLHTRGFSTSDISICLQVKSWVKELRKMLGDSVELCIVGNKIDKEKERHVSAATAQE